MAKTHDRQSFDEKVASALARLTELERSARPNENSSVVSSAQLLEELSTALEELHVADEELRVKNEELEAASLRYQELFELAPDAYLITDLKGKVRQGNHAASALLRLSPTFMEGRVLPAFVTKQDRRELRRLLLVVAGGQPVRDRDVLISPPNALPVPCAFSVLPLRDTANRITGLLWLIRDITDRKRALEFEQKARSELIAAHRALAESEDRYRAIADLVPYGGWLADRLGGYTFVSNSFLQLTGMSQADCQGDGWIKCLPPQKAEKVLADWKSCVRNECKWDYELEILNADGDPRIVWSRGIPIRDVTGQITGWGGLHIDITTRKQVEESLRAAEERFRVALGDSPVTVFQQDRDLRYTWVYHPTQMIPEEIIGKRDEDISSPEIAAHLTEIKESVIKSGIGRHEQVQWASKDFARWTDLTVEPHRDGNGTLMGITGVASDITQLKREQEALTNSNTQLDRAVAERTAELQEANTRLRGLMQIIVSVQEEERRRVSRELHDEAGQALTALKMNLEVMQDDIPADLPQVKARMDEMVHLIADTIEEIRILAQDLRPPALDAANINAVLEGVCRDFARRGRIQVYYHGATPPALPEVANVTLYRFVQEALTNVIKHAQATEVEVVLDWDAEELNLSVRDDGRGFDVRPKSSTLKPQGLGLVGMQERIQAVGGWLEIHSEPGRGTLLTAHIPYKEAE